MLLVEAKCTHCGNLIHLDPNAKTNYCLYCGCRIEVEESVQHYKLEREKVFGLSENDEASIAELMLSQDKKPSDALKEAEAYLTNNSYTRAESIFTALVQTDPSNFEARWGILRARTKKLTPIALDTAEDFFFTEAGMLFEEAADVQCAPWREQYYEAFYACCVLSLKSYDPKVFIEASVYRWNTKENRFEYPISSQYDLNDLLNKTVRKRLVPLAEVLRTEQRERYIADIETLCENIKAYFRKGFENVEAMQRGDMKDIEGFWELKRTNGETKNNILRFSQNPVGVHYCEAMRTTFSRYEYYRFVQVGAQGAVFCREMRTFPSSSGAGGDYRGFEQPKMFMRIFALYDFLLVMPSALYTRAQISETDNGEQAMAFRKKCISSPVFARGENGRGGEQMRPITDNHNTAEPTRTVSACFIATAVYGDENAEQVLRLRKFRDETLHQSAYGRRFSDWYYRTSPPIAERLRKAPRLNRLIRTALDAFVAVLGKT